MIITDTSRVWNEEEKIGSYVKEIERMRKELEEVEREKVVGDYELIRESGSYILKLYYDEVEAARKYGSIEGFINRISAGKVTRKEGMIEYESGYDGIRIILSKLERERAIDEYILGMVHAELGELMDKVLYIREIDGVVNIYSEYSIDRWIRLYKVKGLLNTLGELTEIYKEKCGVKSFRYEIKLGGLAREFIEDLGKELYIQEIV